MVGNLAVVARSLVAVVHILPDRNPVVHHHNPLDLAEAVVEGLVEVVEVHLLDQKVVVPDIHHSSEVVVGRALVGLVDRNHPSMPDLLGLRLEDQEVVVAWVELLEQHRVPSPAQPTFSPLDLHVSLPFRLSCMRTAPRYPCSSSTERSCLR